MGESDDGKPLFTVEDIRKVFAGSKIRLTPDGEQFMAMLACQADEGCLRAVKRLRRLQSCMPRECRLTPSCCNSSNTSGWGDAPLNWWKRR